MESPLPAEYNMSNILAECRSLCVIPAQAGIQAMYFSYFLDSRFRGNDTP